MRLIFGLVLILGVALALVAVRMARGVIDQTEAALSEERAFREKVGNLVLVYVAARPLAYGEAVTPEDVRQIYWQESELPERAFLTQDDLFPPDATQPRYVLRPMEAQEPILGNKVTAPGQPAGLTGLLSPGMRAFTIEVDAIRGVSGFVHPGDFVDVYWTGADAAGNDSTRMIETRLSVVAVDQQASSEDMGGAVVAQTVTVQTGPEQVARLAQAQATGILSLALVGQQDGLIRDTSEIMADQVSLMGKNAPPSVVVCRIKTRRGSEVVDIPIPCTN